VKYFYKLGHQGQLGVSEYQALTGEQVLESNHDWFLADSKVNVNATGSLVFGGTILGQIDLSSFDPSSRLTNDQILALYKQIEKFVKPANTENELKKVGVTMPGFFDKRFLNYLKDAGCKKVNLLAPGVIPTIGNLKNTKVWLAIFIFQKSLVVGKIETYFNQEFWGDLDMDLPEKDMKRGIINLKLARTLMNLTNKRIVWDPFCGLGRNLVAGLDLKDEFVASDIDPACLPGANKNLEFAQQYFNKFGFNELARRGSIFSLDATRLDRIKDQDFANLAIVTEGFLGYNFTRKPTRQNILEQFEEVKQMWKKVLQASNYLGIKEVVFCLPFYNFESQTLLPTFLESLINGTNYQYQKLFGDQKYLCYARKDAFVGHFILKVSLT
jgi:tRNA G10  N-methylase Trm11